MNNRWQEGAYLESQITWANQNFTKCFLHIGDTLQRYNFLDRLSAEDAHRASYIMGSAWLARNEPIVEKLTIPFQIIRWDRWRHHPSFPSLRSAIQDYYDTNRFFRGIVARDVERFTTRNPSTNPSRCVDYLLEEAAGDTLFCRENSVVRVYPASELATYSHLSKTQVPEYLKGLNLSTRVRVSFHRRKDGGVLRAASGESGLEPEEAERTGSGADVRQPAPADAL